VIAGTGDATLPTLRSIGKSHVSQTRAPDGTLYNVVWQQVAVSSGSLSIAIATPLTEVRRSVDTLARSLWVGTPGLIVLVGLLSWVLVGRALRPVEAIRAQVDEITGTTMHRRVPVPNTDDEVARLARTMNGMLDRLQGASARQLAFVSDASHELRSPVSVIRTELEVASADGDQADWPAVAQRTLGETDRLGRLVDDLLALARLDEAQGSPKRVPVDIDDLVLEESTRTHRVPVRTAGVSAGRVAGDARQLTQVVRNLVDNAQRHAATQVAVSLRREDDELVLDVDDDGPGIPEAERENVFDRFTRLDEGRGRADGGAGLGLAVVRRIVEHHGGTVSVGDSELGGASFVVRLPAL
jgi:signal transduction histidine kinase